MVGTSKCGHVETWVTMFLEICECCGISLSSFGAVVVDTIGLT